MSFKYLPYRVKHTERARENRRKPTKAEQIMSTVLLLTSTVPNSCLLLKLTVAFTTIKKNMMLAEQVH